MKHKHILIIALFVFFVCTIAAAQTRRIEAKKKTQESSGSVMNNPEFVFNVGHADFIDSVCYSPDGKYIASSSEDKTVKIWEVETGRELRTLSGHSDEVYSVCYSPDGKYTASSSWDSIKLWEVATGECIKTLSGNGGAYSLCYSPDGRYVASGSWDKTIKLWDVASGECIKAFAGHTDRINSVCYSPNGKYIVSGSEDKTIKLWEVATGECIKTLAGHTDRINSVCYSPDGKYIVSGSEDKTIKLWEAATGECIKTLSEHTSPVYAVAYSLDGKTVASGSLDITIKIWKVATGECIKTLETGAVVRSVSYSPDGAYLASSFWNNEIKLWDIATEECVKTFGGHTKSVSSVAYSLDGKYLATGSADGVKLWNVTTGEHVKKLNGQGNVVYSPDGKYIASRTSKVVNLSEVATGECIKRFEGHTDTIYSVAYSPDGKYIASGSEDKTIKLWEVATGECVKTFEGHTDTVYSVAYSPDGKYVASGSKDETINIWEVASGKCIKTLIGHTSYVMSIAYSPNGKYIASGSLDYTIKLWEVASGNCVKTLEGHTDPVEYVSYSRNGTYLASSSWDRTIKLWKVVTGECIKTLAGHTSWVNSVCYSPDGTYLASGSNDNTIKFWDASTGDLLATTFNLKDGEWLTYTPEGFFAGSEWATKNLVHIVDGMKTVGIDQMYDSLYRPDLVSAKLSGEDISTYAKRVNFASLMQTGSAPITSFLNLDEEITNRDVAIEYSIQNTGGGIGEVNLLLNGKNIRLAENVPSKNGQTLYFSHTVTLQNGKNTLELYAKNEAGKVESLRAKTTLNWHGNTRKPNLYLLTVAVNQYSDRGLQLKYAVPDAQIITQGFSRQKKSLYQNIFTFNLFDGNVTKEGLKSIFQELSKKVEADDVFVFYIAGHGVTYGEDGDYYYLPSNFLFTSSQAIQEQGISKNDLTRCLSLIKAGKTLILMDTCNSGSFLDAGKRGMTEKMAVDRLTRSTGHATIVASSDTQSAMEGYKGHGIFTYIVVEGLSGKADTDGDGFITLQELSSYVEDEVPKRSREKWGYEQIPMRDLRKQDFPIYTSGNR
nr:caspase family protein [uncultured Treponema sp.]